MTRPNKNDSPLYVKSYFASSVDDAMEQARAELGPDALLMNLREAPPEARHLGDCEVVIGVPPSAVPKKVAEAPDGTAEIWKRVEALQKLVLRMGPAGAGRPASALSAVQEMLINAGLPVELASEIDTAVRQHVRNRGVIQLGQSMWVDSGDEVVLREVIRELESRFETDSELGRITAVIGPPGGGKTTTLVKLAVNRGLMADRPVRIISADHYRIAAADQLRTYAAILGVPFTLVETVPSLAQAIDSAPKDALLLIDTPGYSASAIEESGQELACFLTERQDIDTHLVLPASMRPLDLQRTIDRYLPFRPAKLLFTRLDETDSTAAMFCEASARKLPLSFFAGGQVIPEDLEPASKERITKFLVTELPLRCEAVA